MGGTNILQRLVEPELNLSFKNMSSGPSISHQCLKMSMNSKLHVEMHVGRLTYKRRTVCGKRLIVVSMCEE